MSSGALPISGGPSDHGETPPNIGSSGTTPIDADFARFLQFRQSYYSQNARYVGQRYGQPQYYNQETRYGQDNYGQPQYNNYEDPAVLQARMELGQLQSRIDEERRQLDEERRLRRLREDAEDREREMRRQEDRNRFNGNPSRPPFSQNRYERPATSRSQRGERISYNNPKQCGNCFRHGHESDDCIGPIDAEGFIAACPFCNTKDHLLHECRKAEVRNLGQLVYKVLIKRHGKPPVRWAVDYRESEIWVRGPHDKRPWTLAHSLAVYAQNPNLWQDHKYGNWLEELASLPADNAWNDPDNIPSQRPIQNGIQPTAAAPAPNNNNRGRDHGPSDTPKAESSQPVEPKRNKGLPPYAVTLREEIIETVRLFFGAHDVGAHFGVKIQVLINESIGDENENTKRVNAVYPEPVDATNKISLQKCERFLQSWNACNKGLFDDEAKISSEKSLGEWLVEWKKKQR